MKGFKILYLKWKCRSLELELEKILSHVHHDPKLLYRVNELDLQIRSLNQYLGDKSE